jgi:hypothetical protein
MTSASEIRIGEVPKDSPSVTTILSAKNSVPRPTRPLIWFAGALNTTRA